MVTIAGSRFLSKKELGQELNLQSTRVIDGMMQRGEIPYLKLGHRTIRFEKAAVEKALSKLEIHEVGRN